MAGRRRYPSRRRSGRLEWQPSDIAAPVSLTQNSVSVTEMFTAVSANQWANAQILRIIGEWSILAQTEDVLQEAVCGILISDEENLAASGFPDPELDFPHWLYRARKGAHVGALSSTGQTLVHVPFDIKLHRRMRSAEERLIILFKNVSSAAATMLVTYGLRALFRFP